MTGQPATTPRKPLLGILTGLVGTSAVIMAACGGGSGSSAGFGFGGTPASAPRGSASAVATSQQGSPPASEQMLDGCTLLTPAEAGKAMNESFSSGRGDPLGNCMWSSTSVSGDSVTITPEEGGLDKFTFDRSRTNDGDMDLKGIGDRSYEWASSIDPRVEVHFVKNGHYVVVIVYARKASDRWGVAQNVAKAVASHL